MTKVSMLCRIVIMPLLVFSSSVSAKVCTTFEDMYAASGCTVTATKDYVKANNGTKGTVHVRVFINTSGLRNVNKLVHIVGPYEVPQAEPFGLTVMESQINDMRAKGIDVVYYDFSATNSDYAQKKAYALMAAMKKIDSLRGNTKSSIMLGLSIGGVVARYALTSLEAENYSHGVRYFISYDSPHFGAYIPPSLQRIPLFIQNAARRAKNDNDGSASFLGPLLKILDPANLISVNNEHLSELIPNAERSMEGVIGNMSALLNDQINSPAPKQMLVRNIFSSNGRDPLASTLLAELKALGFPKGKGLQTKNIALTKGSIFGNKFSPDNRYYFNFYSNHAGSGAGVRTINITANVVGAAPYPIYVTPPGCYSSSCVDFSKTTYGNYVFNASMRYKDISSFGSDTYTEHFATSANSSPTAYAWDIMPCSTLDLPATIAAVANPQLNELNLTQNGPFAALQKSSCFIPTSSALGQESVGAVIPFDAYYGQPSNLDHREFKGGELREKGNGNYFEDDFEQKYLIDAYVTNAGWSYKNPTSTTTPVNYTIYSSPSEYACYMSWGYTGRVMKWVAPDRCYVQNP